jgi:hypothetical protein
VTHADDVTDSVGFHAEDEPFDEHDDVLILGADKRPRWYSRPADCVAEHRALARAGLWLAGALVVGLAVSRTLPMTTRTAAPASPTPAATTAPYDPQQQPMASVLALARNDRPLTDYVRQTSTRGACALVPVGHSPTRAIAEAVRRALPEFTGLDVGRTLDQFTGLCSVDLRATHGRHATLTLSVAAPAPHTVDAAYTYVQTGIRTSAGVTTKYVWAVTRTGWTILIGATGNDRDLPGVQDLLELTEQRSLTW